ncbi:MAG TPA: flagellar biosynthesis protein FliQ [Tepidisphaeraceae bacterium]|jgi:flagellar biosynthetic protein FliQ|nr:flagellar biosynthesis protein FliQ [Tepidisphaeraceae bacterium]
MTLDQATNLLRECLIMVLTIASPMLLIGLFVGVVISLVQAITQIQEQTLSFVPKITAMFLAAAVLMPWIGTRLMEYTAFLFESITP